MRISTAESREPRSILWWSMVAMAAATIGGIVTARGLGPSDRGVLATILITVTLTAMLAGVGTNVAIRTHLPSNPAVNLRTYFTLSAMLAFALLGLVPLIMIALSFGVADSLRSPTIVLSTALCALLCFGSNQTLDATNAVGHPAVSARDNAVGAVATLLSVLACTTISLDVPKAVLSFALGFAIRIVCAYIGLRDQTFGRFSRSGGALLLRDGSRLIGLNLGQSLAYRVDQYLVGLLLGPTAIGIYSVAATPSGVLRVVGTSFGQLAFRDAAFGLASQHIAQQLRKAVMLTGALAAVGVLTAPMLVPLVFGKPFEAAVLPTQILIAAEVLLVPFLIYSRALVGYGRVNAPGLLGTSGIVVSIAAVWGGITLLGLPGAALGAVLTFAALSAAAILLFRKQHFVDTPGGN